MMMIDEIRRVNGAEKQWEVSLPSLLRIHLRTQLFERSKSDLVDGVSIRVGEHGHSSGQNEVGGARCACLFNSDFRLY